MEHEKTATPVISPADAVDPTPIANATLTTTLPESNANTTTMPSPTNNHMSTLTTDENPPQYEGRDREVVPAPAQAINPGPPIEKTGWEAATQAPIGPPGQGLVAGRAVELNQLDEEPRWINCPFCHQETMTRVNKESTGTTGMAAVACCLFGGICCAFIPYCMEMCHDSHHFCTNCGQKVAIRPHDGAVQVFLPEAPVVTAPGYVQPPQAVAVSHGPNEKS
ncbi:LPS-induced tumor necrosis factor alpha factor [Penicillium macrosclerotiorum]|uniref:LPS-induced tumor necrosis factor alpha factor n=1 Tax=Penicillium macrosclerotiorum TaxID=303699 RepID=UPI002547C44E|nr:LPS-induced tumor necrosis factor alpha factor [Penicillium macrosclerotiorum]KAJ5690149.1 LPS-induced tumor necrosis factor alpha factor [Penicillium macrosclerotiorum]